MLTCSLLQAVIDFCPWHVGSHPSLGPVPSVCPAQPSSLPASSPTLNHCGSWGGLALRQAWGSHSRPCPQRAQPFGSKGVTPALWPTDFLSCLLDASMLQTQGSCVLFIPACLSSNRKTGCVRAGMGLRSIILTAKENEAKSNELSSSHFFSLLEVWLAQQQKLWPPLWVQCF